MQSFWRLAVVGCLFALPAHAQTAPPKPVISDIPKVATDGTPIRGLRIRATTATRLADGRIFVMYGFAMGRFDGTANFFLWNSDLDAYCEGKTRSDSAGNGGGRMTCWQGSQIVSRQNILIPSKTYGRLSGTVHHIGTDPAGNQTHTILAWALGKKFPDPMPLLEMLDTP